MGYSFNESALQKERDLGLGAALRDMTPAFDEETGSDLHISQRELPGADIYEVARQLQVEIASAVPMERSMTEEQASEYAVTLAEYEVVSSLIRMIEDGSAPEIVNPGDVIMKEDAIHALELHFALHLDALKESNLSAPINDASYDEALDLATAIVENMDGKCTQAKLITLVEDLQSSINALRTRESVGAHV